MRDTYGPHFVALVILVVTLLFGWHTYKFAQKSIDGLEIHMKTMDDILNGNP